MSKRNQIILILLGIFLIFPKDVFNVFNSIVYTLVVYLIYLNVKGDNKKDKPLFLLAIHFCLWFL